LGESRKALAAHAGCLVNADMESSTATRSYLVGRTEIAARPIEAALYLVATPIGNLGDITLRALETLAGADILACEDTRVTRVLLDRYAIRQRPTAYHDATPHDARRIPVSQPRARG